MMVSDESTEFADMKVVTWRRMTDGAREGRGTKTVKCVALKMLSEEGYIYKSATLLSSAKQKGSRAKRT